MKNTDANFYDCHGDNYDATRRADPEIVEHFSRLLNPHSEGRYLDLACGTGNYTAALAQGEGRWHGFDQSIVMLQQAQLKSTGVIWDQFDVNTTDYKESYFDGAICSLALHHFTSLPHALHEIARTVKPAASLILFTALPTQMHGYWLNHYFPHMMRRSIEQMPSLESILSAAQSTSFTLTAIEPFFITPQLQDLFLYSGKQRPEIYLQKSVRAGISSFQHFCCAEEQETGLAALRQDLQREKFDEIATQYENSLGDYTFIQLQRNA